MVVFIYIYYSRFVSLKPIGKLSSEDSKFPGILQNFTAKLDKTISDLLIHKWKCGAECNAQRFLHRILKETRDTTKFKVDDKPIDVKGVNITQLYDMLGRVGVDKQKFRDTYFERKRKTQDSEMNQFRKMLHSYLTAVDKI